MSVSVTEDGKRRGEDCSELRYLSAHILDPHILLSRPRFFPYFFVTWAGQWRAQGVDTSPRDSIERRGESTGCIIGPQAHT
jgi:hypothetical protein